jgi:lysozyme
MLWSAATYVKNTKGLWTSEMTTADPMKLSATGEAMIKGFEGYRSAAYLDSGGTPTIGWGHTGWYSPGVPVALGQTCKLEQAEEWFQSDTSWAVAAVNKLIRRPMTNGQFDALTDFTYNCGIAALAHSTVRRDFNAGDTLGAANALLEWDYAGEQVSAGLEARRKAERALFLA